MALLLAVFYGAEYGYLLSVLRLLRQREQENLPIAAQLKQKRLKIEAEIAEIECETKQLRAGNAQCQPCKWV
ncbi:hypothetical protein KBY70_00020 [Cyanobium sp. ATX 6E8]|uniref:hypothetical protein n=1 Tax=Cyanobium sp. ATX 6E8 TaxID=2823701 RepID=UPI0020CB8003|nr:hypothetical protein [Cyanobium sp. ATX 6E8]MCP9940794.1 hypothetical protein [Cyanobium sp. ATX 6E8]